jgi:Lon protease-like protein
MRRRLRLFPLNAVLFPGTALNLHIFEPRYRQMIEECAQRREGFGVVLIADGAEVGDPNVRPHDVGAIAEIVEVTALPFERYYVSAIGGQRFRIHSIVSREPYLIAEVDTIEEAVLQASDGLTVAAFNVRDLFAEYRTLLAEFSGAEIEIELPDDAREFSYVVADGLQVAQAVKQHLLEMDDTIRRLETERSFLERVLPQLRKLLKRRRKQLQARRPQDQADRGRQEKFFGKFFSAN